MEQAHYSLRFITAAAQKETRGNKPRFVLALCDQERAERGFAKRLQADLPTQKNTMT